MGTHKNSKTLTTGRFSRITVADRAVDAVQRWWFIMSGGYLALGTAYAKFSTALPAFGWIDAVALGTVGSLILTLITLTSILVFRKINPRQMPLRDRKEFIDEVVYLSDLVAYAPMISDKSFVRCVIRGPGQIKMQSHVVSLFCSLLERNLVMAIEGSNVTGATMVHNCSFIECYFDTAIVGTVEDISQLRGAVDIIPLQEWEQRYVEYKG